MNPECGGKALRMIFAASIACGPVAPAHAQPTASKAAVVDRAPSLIQEMVGIWDVQQRMWPGAGAKAIELPPTVAARNLIGNTVLYELMTLAPGSTQESFTRVAYFNYNSVNRQYEYFSLDTRAPQMMNERSNAAITSETRDQDAIKLQGGRFVAAQWGDAKNVPFHYRIEVGKIENDRQLVRLYLTPESKKSAAQSAKEFLAFEYIYTRRR